MKKNIFLLIFLILLGKLAGFFKELVLGYYYGASVISDIYIISTTIPLLIFDFFSQSVSISLVPTYLGIAKNESEYSAKKFTNKLLNFILIIVFLIIILIFILDEQLIYIFASGFSNETINQTTSFLRIISFSLIFYCFSAVFKSYLSIHKNYWISGIISVPMYIIIILGIIVSSFTTPVVIAYSFLIASSTQVIIMLPFIIKTKFKFSFDFKVFSKDILSFFIIALPMLFVVGVNDINKIINRTIASSIVVGGVSALNYAGKLSSLIQGTMVLAVTTVIYPTITRLYENKDVKSASNQLNKIGLFVVYFVLPISILFIIYSNQIVEFLFGRGAFDENAINLTSGALKFYSIGITFFIIKQIIMRSFFANKNFKIPIINSIIALVTNLIISLYLYLYTDMGISGLALATSISVVISTIHIILKYKKYFDNTYSKDSLIDYVKIFISSFILAIISIHIYNLFLKLEYFNVYLVLFFSIGISLVIYLVITILIKVNIATNTLKYVLNYFKKNSIKE